MAYDSDAKLEVIANKIYHSYKGAKEFTDKYPSTSYIRQIEKIGGSTWKVLIFARRKQNPMKRGKWIPAHAVRFNKDGSVSIMK